MNKIVLLALAAMIASCSSPEKKCQKQAENFVKEIVLDPASYQSVSFSALDSLFSIPKNHKDFNVLEKKVFDIDRELSNLETDIILAKNWDEEKTLRQKKIDLTSEKIKVLEEMEAYEKKFKGTWLGWTMTHRFRAMSKAGLMVLEEKKFYYDKEYVISDYPSLLAKEGVR